MIQKTDTIECHLHKDNGIDDPSIYHHLVTEFLSSTFFQVILRFDHTYTCQFGCPKRKDILGANSRVLKKY